MHPSTSKATDDFAEKQVLDLGPAKLCYRRAGQGPALVLLHGFPLSGLTWRNVVPLLAKEFTCYAFDLVGLGCSTSSDLVDFSSPGQAAVLQRALRAAGIESYTLLGNDTGGWVARELALLERERVTHLVLTNTEIPGHRPPWIPMYQFLARLPGSSSVFRGIISSRRIRRSAVAFGGCFTDLDRIDGEVFDLFLKPLITSQERLSDVLRFLVQMRFDRLDRFRELHANLAMPVSFVWSVADPTFPEKDARAMLSRFSNVAGFTSVPRGKLFFYEEHPELLAEAVLRQNDRVRVS